MVSLLGKGIVERKPMKRSQAISIAKKHAKNSSEPYTKEEKFQPHDWVVRAILEAANNHA